VLEQHYGECVTRNGAYLAVACGDVLECFPLGKQRKSAFSPGILLAEQHVLGSRVNVRFLHALRLLYRGDDAAACAFVPLSARPGILPV
jgi:hypothetical protein